jgi:DNA-binding NtrC family response regulator
MHNLKILVVEDDPVTLNIMEKLLMKAGYDVETARNGVEAVDVLSKRFFDVVLTDLMMPGGIDGIGVLEATKAKWHRTEVIVMTAYATLDNAVEALKKGAIDYLQKPVNFEELTLRLQRMFTLKLLSKDASDLREAMDVTEKTCGQTIQDLEIMVSGLRDSCCSAASVLANQDMEIHERVRRALEIIFSQPLICLGRKSPDKT